MPKFIAVTKDTPDPKIPRIKFTVEITENEVTFLGNGKTIAFIPFDTGVLELCRHDGPVTGLKYASDKFIEVRR